MLTVLIGAHKKWLRSGSEMLRGGLNSLTDTNYNTFDISNLYLEPTMGLEPMTCRLRIGCSTTKLRWHGKKPPILDRFNRIVKSAFVRQIAGLRRGRPGSASHLLSH